MSKKLNETIKKIAVEAVLALKPTENIIGYVIQEAPLRIQISQRLILDEDDIVLTRNVSDYTLTGIAKQTIGHIHKVETKETESGGAHEHEVIIYVNDALKTGEVVELLRVRRGQKYIVLDRKRGG